MNARQMNTKRVLVTMPLNQCASIDFSHSTPVANILILFGHQAIIFRIIELNYVRSSKHCGRQRGFYKVLCCELKIRLLTPKTWDEESAQMTISSVRSELFIKIKADLFCAKMLRQRWEQTHSR